MDGIDDFADRVRFVTLLLAFGVLAWVAYRSIINPPPPVSLSLANGTYTSTCCGRITLNNGLMTFGKQRARYNLFVTKTDLSASVDGEIIVTPNHIVTKLTDPQMSAFSFWRYPHRSNGMNLYDARRVPPDRLSIWGQDHSGPYDFAITSR